MSKPTKSFDPTFLAGLLIALACILGGLVLEKGEVKDVIQITSGLIVFGGTIGAVVISTPKNTLIRALSRCPSVMWSSVSDPVQVLEQITRLASVARRDGNLGLDKHLAEIRDPFFRKGMQLVADGSEAQEVRSLLETDLLVSEMQADEDARVFDTAGGYAPTIGIIGAVLGLMQVMKHLDNIQDVGRGIAIAFVATVYGVGIANLILLPIASKIRTQARQHSSAREMVIEGVLAIQGAKNPRLIRQALEPFLFSKTEEQTPENKETTPINYTDRRKAS